MIIKLIETVYAFLWGDLFTIPVMGSSVGISLMLLLLIPAGVYFTIRTRLLPVRLFSDMMKALKEKKETPDSLSSLQTLIISTATRVGMGNLVGVVAAVSLGGAGAIFWMWITALLGASTAFVEAVLAQKYNVLKTEGNLNNEIGLPLTIFKIREEHQVAVLEMGISEFGEMDRLSTMANPDICVITNIGLCHLENLITRDGILKAKTESFAHLTPDGIAVLNGDDDKLCDKKVVNGKPAVFYGIEKAAKVAETEEGQKTLAEKTVYATNVEAVGLTGTKAAIHYPSRETGGEVTMEVTIPIAGEHNVYNALAAVSVARELGLTCEEMKRGIESVQTIGGRSNLIHKNGVTIIDDCYNANPVSMKASIDVLSKAPGRKIAVLGDMGELGAEEKQLHYMVGEHFAGKGIDALYCAGILSQEIAKAVRACSSETEVHDYEDKADLIKDLVKEVQSGDTVLVKASHFMGFPEIVKKLTK